MYIFALLCVMEYRCLDGIRGPVHGAAYVGKGLEGGKLGTRLLFDSLLI